MSDNSVQAVFIVCITVLIILTLGEYDLLDAIIEMVSSE